MNLDNIKNQFPIFSKKINNKNLVYLDSSNSSQTIQSGLMSHGCNHSFGDLAAWLLFMKFPFPL